MPKRYTDEYFENKQEQAQIAQALYAAIPENVQYYNLIFVLSGMIETMLGYAFKDEIFTHKADNKS